MVRNEEGKVLIIIFVRLCFVLGKFERKKKKKWKERKSEGK